MLLKHNFIVDLLFHLILCPMAYSPSTFTASNAQPLMASNSFTNDYYMDSERDSRSNGARDAYGNKLSQGYAGSGYQAADSSSGRYSSGTKGHQSHLASSQNEESDGSIKHSEGSLEAEKDRVVKHQWDRGGGYVKEWNWDKGVHYEKETGSVSASDLKHKESERLRQSGEKSKGSAGWQQNKDSEHDKWKAAEGYGKKGYRNENSNGYSDAYGSTDSARKGYKKYGSPADPWIETAEYIPLKAAASAVNRPNGLVHHPSSPYYDGGRRVHNGWSEKANPRYKSDYRQSLRDLIEKKYMPIYRKYSLASKQRQKSNGKSEKKTRENSRRHIDLRMVLSKEFLGPQGRWKLGHLFGNGLDAFSPSSRFLWH